MARILLWGRSTAHSRRGPAIVGAICDLRRQHGNIMHTAAMKSAECLLEIPRSVAANVTKLGLSLLLIVFGAAMMPGPRSAWQLGVILWVIAAMLIVNNIRMLVRRPPMLRATREGLWFGGGPLIAWHEVACVYEAGIPIERYGFSVRTRAINIAFHRKRTMLRLPSSLWLTTWTPGQVKISLYTLDDLPNAVVTRLEALRKQATGDDVRALDAVAPPSARVVSRR